MGCCLCEKCSTKFLFKASSDYTEEGYRTSTQIFLRNCASLCVCLSVDRIPEAGVSRDWPENIYFTFQFYRFPPVTSQQLRLLTSDKVQQKADSPLPCLLASINRDGTVNSGKNPFLREKALLFLLKNHQVCRCIDLQCGSKELGKDCTDALIWSHDLDCWKLAKIDLSLVLLTHKPNVTSSPIGDRLYLSFNVSHHHFSIIVLFSYVRIRCH